MISGCLGEFGRVCSGLSPHITQLQRARSSSKKEQSGRGSLWPAVEGIDDLVTGTETSEAKSCLLLENHSSAEKCHPGCENKVGYRFQVVQPRGRFLGIWLHLQYQAFCMLHFYDFCTMQVPHDKQTREIKCGMLESCWISLAQKHSNMP